MKHEISRVRHDVRRRKLVVSGADYVTPKMLRLRLEGGDLAGFTSGAPDDHIKVFTAAADGREERRDYTPRRYDAAKNELLIDFALHEAGPVTDWARNAKPGDTIEIGGPRGSIVVPDDFDWWLLIGDETALPAIGRRIEEASPGRKIISIVSVTDVSEEQLFDTMAVHRAIWVHRPLEQADDPSHLVRALDVLDLPSGDGFVWIAAEANVARALRSRITDEMGHPAQWLKASGYWVKGQADTSMKVEL